MKKYFFTSFCFVVAFVFVANFTKAQTPQQNLDKYWSYRNRLVKSFETIGMGEGKSLPASRRNGTNAGSDDDSGLPNDHMYWGDDGRTMGYYIGTLATEYALLKNNGQNTNETVMELFYALHTLFRLDSTAVRLWAQYQEPFSPNFPVSTSSYNVNFPGLGYMIGDDIPPTYRPSDYSVNLPPSPYYVNPSSSTTLYVSSVQTGQVGPVNQIFSGFADLQNSLGSSSTTTASEAKVDFKYNDAYSIDNYFAVLMGLSLANKLLGNGITSFVDQNGHTQNFSIHYGDLHQMSYKLEKAIITYLMYSYDTPSIGDYYNKLEFLDGTSMPSSYGAMAAFLKPLYNLASQYNVPIIIPSDASADNDFWNNYTFCNGIAAFPLFNNGLISAGCPSRPSIQNIEIALYMCAMTNLNGAYTSPKAMINGMGNYGNDVGCFPCFSTLPANHYGWNLFYLSVLQVLYPGQINVTSLNLCDFETILNGAPPDGPFFHSNSDYAYNGWASDKRFVSLPPAQDIGAAQQPIGNFNGLDYMLFYNLYCLTQQIDEQFYHNIVINDESNAASYVQFEGQISGGIPDQYPFDFHGWYINPYGELVNGWDAFGYESNPFYLTSVDCKPIIVNKLLVKNNVTLKIGDAYDINGQTLGGIGTYPNQSGALVLNGGEYSYIDMVPTEGPIEIEQGTFFDATCSHSCCEPEPNSYISDITIPYLVKTKQNGDNVDSTNSYLPAPYKASPEFVTLPTYDAILNYPNPFTNQTTFEFAVKETTPVSIAVYDTHGAKVADVIANQIYNQGSYAVNFNASALASGSYICIMTTKDDKKTVEIIKSK